MTWKELKKNPRCGKFLLEQQERITGGQFPIVEIFLCNKKWYWKYEGETSAYLMEGDYPVHIEFIGEVGV